jgi:hypothetical protein
MRPTAADQERIAEALYARIGAGAGGLSAAPAALVAKAHWLGLSWPVLSTVVVGLAAGGLFIAGALQSETTATPGAAPAVPVAARAAVPPPVADAPAAGAEMAPAVAAHGAAAADTPVVARAPAPRVANDDIPVSVRRQPSDRLAEEVEILSRAQTELHAGQFASSLRLLEEHARKFPRGTLAQERRAARIQALCGMGRMSEADTELARLSPGSVHEGRARQACAAKR